MGTTNANTGIVALIDRVADLVDEVPEPVREQLQNDFVKLLQETTRLVAIDIYEECLALITRGAVHRVVQVINDKASALRKEGIRS